MRVRLVVAAFTTIAFVSCGGGGGSLGPSVLPQHSALPGSAQPPTATVVQTVIKGSGGGPPISVMTYAVSGWPTGKGMTVTTDGAAWWFSENSSGQLAMVRLFGTNVNVIPANLSFFLPNTSAGGPMGWTPNGRAWGTSYAQLVHGPQASESFATSTTSEVDSAFAISLTFAGMTTGPDGNLWYANNSAPPIPPPSEPASFGYIPQNIASNGTPPAAFTDPNQNDVLTTIATGPDMQLWIGGLIDNGTQLGFYRYSTTFQLLSTIPITETFATPSQAVAGPDNALWFVDGGSNVIGRITGNGSLTTYPIPTANAGANWITQGGDGALWFTESTAGKLGRISPIGQISEYMLPTQDFDPSQVVGPTTSGCGANELWLAAGGSAVQVIITAGASTNRKK